MTDNNNSQEEAARSLQGERRGSSASQDYFAERIKLLRYASVLAIVVASFVFLIMYNPGVIRLNEQTLSLLNQAVNATVLLSIPFLLGSSGALARLLLADLDIEEHFKIVPASGMIGAFSWLGIKSKLFIALLTPYVERTMEDGTLAVAELTADQESSFYSMALVAVLVGMFSSNIYVFVNQRVEKLMGTFGVHRMVSKTPDRANDPDERVEGKGPTSERGGHDAT